MPTKLYLHNAINDLSGTFPSGEQSAITADWTVSGGTSLRKMDVTVGVAQASLSGTTLALTSGQWGLLGMWVSPPLAGAQTVGGGNLTLNMADQESDLNANFFVSSLNAYVWRPSTGAKVGSLSDVGSSGGTEGGTSETVTHINGIASSAVSAADGDVIVCEVWAYHGQAVAASYTATVYFDGSVENTAENAVVSDHASFIEFAETLAFREDIPPPEPVVDKPGGGRFYYLPPENKKKKRAVEKEVEAVRDVELVSKAEQFPREIADQIEQALAKMREISRIDAEIMILMERELFDEEALLLLMAA